MKTTHAIPTRTFANLRQVKSLPASIVSLHEANYRTVVTKSNDVLERLSRADRSGAHPVFSELRMLHLSLPPLLAAVKCHELMLSRMGPDTSAPRGPLADLITRDFGGHESLVREISAAAMSSRGWVALSYDLDLQRLMLTIGDTPEQLPVWNQVPLVVFEVSAASSVAEFGSDRSRYVRSLLESVDWGVVGRQLEDALGLRTAGHSGD